ncbi:MAG: hypothetical protein NW223_22220 [Hyphomicrobiaceae bacterium]|nr:hypothetical protein [Hyphomicrobiaceae bacterium]
MADGSRSIEADAAAAEAAREARAEALEKADQERLNLDKVKAADARKAQSRKPARPERSRPDWAEFKVQFWITNFNSVEFGIYKHSRNRAKSRQFSSDMDVVAEVLEGGLRTGVLAYREDLWKDNTGMDKRLVFKLFTDSLNWRATMDLMIGRSLQLTTGAHGMPVTSFSVNTGDHENMVYLERSAHKWPFMPEDFSFFLLEGNRPTFYRLRQDFIDLGGDYTLYDEQGNAVGYLDGAVFTVRGRWKVRVRKEHADPRLMMVLKLFCGMLIFNRPARRHMRRIYKDVRAGRLIPKIEKQEADLYMNPRRVR